VLKGMLAPERERERERERKRERCNRNIEKIT
jgi:hypothetical protein